MYRILIVTAEPSLVQTHAGFLQMKGCSADIVTNSVDTLSLMSDNSYDLVLMDVNVSDINGFDLCNAVHSKKDVPVIFLSALFDDLHQIKAFSSGACEYISLGSSLELFWVRIQARMSISSSPTEVLREFPPLILDLQRQRAYIENVNLRLTQIEFALLALLSSRPRVIWSVEELYTEIWGTSSAPDPQIVQAHLSRMRRKIEKAYPRHDFIETVWRKGYQFIPVATS